MIQGIARQSIYASIVATGTCHPKSMPLTHTRRNITLGRKAVLPNCVTMK